MRQREGHESWMDVAFAPLGAMVTFGRWSARDHFHFHFQKLGNMSICISLQILVPL